MMSMAGQHERWGPAMPMHGSARSCDQRVIKGIEGVTASPSATMLVRVMAPTTGQPPIRLAVPDPDTGFLRVLANRLEAAGWQHRVLASPVPIDALVSMRLNVLVVDPTVLGPAGW